MDPNVKPGHVRKGRGWDSSDANSEPAALRADAPQLPDHRQARARSPSFLDAVNENDEGVHSPSEAEWATRKAQRQEGVLPLPSPLRMASHVSGSSAGILPIPPIRPTQDWVCSVCSNWNSSQRSSCFRCSTTYQDSLGIVPTREIAVGPLSGVSAEDVVQAILTQLEAAGMLLSPEDCRALATPTGVFTYVQFENTAMSAKAMTLLRCTLRLGAVSHMLKFSREAYVYRMGTRQHARAHGDDEATGDGGRSSTESVRLPDHLQPARWEAPTTFPSAEAEKQYLREMSDHWAGLTAAQRAFYDERVRLALQSPSKRPTPEVATASPPASALPKQTAKVDSPLTAAPSGAVSSLKERLALRRAAKAATPTTQRATTEGVPASTNPAAQALANGGGEPTGSSSAVPIASGVDVESEAEDVVAFFYGMPVPPMFCRPDGVYLPTRLALRGMPLAVAERLLPPHCLQDEMQ